MIKPSDFDSVDDWNEYCDAMADAHREVPKGFVVPTEGICAPGPQTASEVIEHARRKGIPMYSGALVYFPDAWEKLAELSRIGNDQHNPGSPLHWDRSKSGDELDALMRHLKDHAKGILADTDGVWHLTKVLWRAAAALQKECERVTAQAED